MKISLGLGLGADVEPPAPEDPEEPVAPTYFGSASLPADAGTNATTTLTITPPASMLAGDLVVVIGQSRSAGTWTIGVNGGQSWTSETSYANGSNANSCRIFWCTFDGTWDASPQFNFSDPSPACDSVVMHVFRPADTSDVWAIDVALDSDIFALPVDPFTVTRTGLTTAHDSTVTLACWHTLDDNQWGSLAGTGWAVTGSAQYRNLSSTDQSSTFAHYLAADSGTIIPDVSKNEATNGGDDGITAIISWYAS